MLKVKVRRNIAHPKLIEKKEVVKVNIVWVVSELG